MPPGRTLSHSVFQHVSTNGLQQQIKDCLQFLTREQVELSRAYEIFTSGQEVWPDQCKRVMRLFEKIREPIHDVYTLLKYPERLPSRSIAYRRLLLITLQHVDQQTTELPPLIRHFRTICRHPSAQTRKQQQIIQSKLEILLRSYDETLHHMTVFCDVIRFQERETAFPLEEAHADDTENE